MTNSNFEISAASFRDPSGYIFTRNGRIYRAISYSYQENYDFLISSGLYNKLIDENLLIPHIELADEKNDDQNIYKIVQPEQLPFISYPYEWSFTQLKDAALLTLRIQKIAFEYGMSLKDSSAFNIQFRMENLF